VLAPASLQFLQALSWTSALVPHQRLQEALQELQLLQEAQPILQGQSWISQQAARPHLAAAAASRQLLQALVNQLTLLVQSLTCQQG
jgi:uncharacterized protein VirK/YbjX